jgi:hypothetical protein
MAYADVTYADVCRLHVVGQESGDDGEALPQRGPSPSKLVVLKYYKSQISGTKVREISGEGKDCSRRMLTYGVADVC